MNKIIKFVYVPLDKNYEFEQTKRENGNIVPCSIYVDKVTQKVYFVERQTGAIMDGNIFDIPDISDKVLGL